MESIADRVRCDRVPPFTRAACRLFLGVALLAALYAALGWRAELADTGGSTRQVWPLHVANLAFFFSATAGLVLAPGLTRALGVVHQRALAAGAEALAVAGLVLAAVFVLLDLARTARVARLVRPDHFDAPITWDLLIAATYFCMVAAVGYGRRALGPALPGAASLAAALLLYAMSASILGVLGIGPGWPSVLIALVFVVPTLVAGLALWILVAALVPIGLEVQTKETIVPELGRALLRLIPVLALSLLGETLSVAQAAGGAGGHIAHELLVGDYAPFVLFGFIGGLVLPFVLLMCRRTRTVRGIGLAAVLVVGGVLAARWHLIAAGALRHAHPPGATGGYAPTWPELSSTVAGYAVALLVCASSTWSLRRSRLGGAA